MSSSTRASIAPSPRTEREYDTERRLPTAEHELTHAVHNALQALRTSPNTARHDPESSAPYALSKPHRTRSACAQRPAQCAAGGAPIMFQPDLITLWNNFLGFIESITGVDGLFKILACIGLVAIIAAVAKWGRNKKRGGRLMTAGRHVRPHGSHRDEGREAQVDVHADLPDPRRMGRTYRWDHRRSVPRACRVTTDGTHLPPGHPGHRRATELSAAREEDEAALATARLLYTLHPTHWDPSLLRPLRHQLCARFYDWAGQYRTVEISKGTSRFAAAQRITQPGRGRTYSPGAGSSRAFTSSSSAMRSRVCRVRLRSLRSTLPV
ncbi:hypothetical protein AIF0345_2220 [Actinomyces israelii]|nr:hypothetical protein AIF0345_2220 [Actinomyces israelii]